MRTRHLSSLLPLFLAVAACGDDASNQDDTGADASMDTGDASDAGGDTTDTGGLDDTGLDVGADIDPGDTGGDAAPDAGGDVDTGTDVGDPGDAGDVGDTGLDVGDASDAGDAGMDGGVDASPDVDAGPPDDRTDDDLDPLVGSWLPDFGVAGMTGDLGGQVYDTAVHPTTGEIWAGGAFTNAGGVEAMNVAVWDGVDWAPVGDGVVATVRAIAFDDDGTVYVGGAGGGGFIPVPNHVAAWDGSTWTTLGDALPMFTQVNDLAVVDGDLVAVGTFDASWAGQAGLARWDGSTWTTLTEGAGAVSVSTILTGAPGLCVGGTFDTIDDVRASNVACYGEGAWVPLGDGLNSTVEVLIPWDDGSLLAGGWFTEDDVIGLAVFADGTWTGFEAGGVGGGLTTKVRDLAVDEAGNLYVGGQFDGVGEGLPSANVALYRAEGGWLSMGGGVFNRVGFSIEPGVFAIALADGGAYMGGDFSEAGSVTTSNYAFWDGLAWGTVYDPTKSANGVNGIIEALAAGPDGTIYAGGSFTSAGTASAINVAAFDGSVWSGLGAGIEGGVRALGVDASGRLWVGGAFTDAGPERASRLAWYDGVVFRPATDAPDAEVQAIAPCPDGSLIVTGGFVAAGGVTLNHIGRYEPGVGWSALGGGLGGDGFWQVPAVHCGDDGVVHVGGGFTTVDGASMPYLARWTGAAWEAVGDAPDDDVTALDVYDGVLYVGGSFTSFGETAAVGAASWTEADGWSQMGDGLATEWEFSPANVVDLQAKSNGVFATGMLTRSGETVLGNVAWFDGEAWHDLDGGTDDLTSAGIVDNERFYVGGPFTTAGGVPSLAIAAWAYGD